MKKIMLFALMAILLGGVFFVQTPASAAGGGPTTTVVDSENAAHALVLVGNWSQAIFQAPYMRMCPDGTAQYIQVWGTMNHNGWFPLVYWDGVQIVGPNDPPLKELPNDSKGIMTNVSFNVWVQANGMSIQGWTYVDNLKAGAPIVVEMRPGWVSKFIAYDATVLDVAGLDAGSLRLQLTNGGLCWYDEDAGGFWVGVDPLSTVPVDYEIYVIWPDGEKTILDYGSVVWNANPTEISGSAITLRYVGGVVDAYIGPDGSSYQGGLQFGSDIQRNGYWQKAAVLMTDANSQPIYISASGFEGTLEVRDPAQGMKLLMSVSTADNGWAVINLPSGYRGLVITLTGYITYQDGAYVYVSGTYVPPNIPPTIPGGGGGLGAPAQQ